MKLIIDTEAATLQLEEHGAHSEHPLYSREAFEAVSRQWLRLGWVQQYYFTFTWMGRPILQLPEDLLRLQEVVHSIRPDVIIETGVYSGGSLLFYSTICSAIGKGRIIGIDKHIEPETRKAFAAHRLGGRIALIEGNSIAPETLRQVRALIRPDESVLVILDSHHAREHVAAELQLYAPLVTAGSYLLVADGIMRDLAGVPGGEASWAEDNPAAAAVEFAKHHPEFEQRQPEWEFNRSPLQKNITYWPDGWLRRKP
ncbi:MAG: cephalosporin hydroxylase family protein [Bryobacteraceae bacterium]